MGARMLAVKGRVQREGEVVHLVAHKLADYSDKLASIGHRGVAFPMQHGRGDGVKYPASGRDPREPQPEGWRTRDIYLPDLHIDTIKVKTRDFH